MTPAPAPASASVPGSGLSSGPAVPLVVPLRTVDPARIGTRQFAHHRIRLTIDHEPLTGVTPDMLLWWFSHLGGTMPTRAARTRVSLH